MDIVYARNQLHQMIDSGELRKRFERDELTTSRGLQVLRCFLGTAECSPLAVGGLTAFVHGCEHMPLKTCYGLDPDFEEVLLCLLDAREKEYPRVYQDILSHLAVMD